MSKKYFCDKCGKETDKNELYHHAGYSKSYEDLNSKIDAFCSSATSNYISISEPKYYDLCPHCREAMKQWMNIFVESVPVPPSKFITGVFVIENGELIKLEEVFSRIKPSKLN